MLARQFNSHTSQPASSNASTNVSFTGGRNRFARTPAPCTTSTGPRVAGRGPLTGASGSGNPSPARIGMTVSVVVIAVVVIAVVVIAALAIRDRRVLVKARPRARTSPAGCCHRLTLVAPAPDGRTHPRAHPGTADRTTATHAHQQQ